MATIKFDWYSVTARPLVMCKVVELHSACPGSLESGVDKFLVICTCDCHKK